MREGETPKRNVRVPDALWEDVVKIAAEQYESPSTIVRQALREYVRTWQLQQRRRLRYEERESDWEHLVDESEWEPHIDEDREEE
jgi:predicted transcriptional regulator